LTHKIGKMRVSKHMVLVCAAVANVLPHLQWLGAANDGGFSIELCSPSPHRAFA
jgi:hypothetical protein